MKTFNIGNKVKANNPKIVEQLHEFLSRISFGFGDKG